MSQVFMTKRKIVTAVIAVLLATVIVFGGTFAWQSISQQALNEVKATVNPGGRLHDDFSEVTAEGDLIQRFDKDVYVENFTELVNNGVQVYARVRLDEYMEFGQGAGGLNDDGTASAADNYATSLIPGATLANKASWSTYLFGQHSDFRDYWSWDFEGKTVYMPTFNKNKDSLQADINGTYEGTDPNDQVHYDDHVDYALGDQVIDGTAVYDADANTNDEVGSSTDYPTFVGLGSITTQTETHDAKETPEGFVISMEQWVNTGSVPGPYWVYDTDGWAYWASPIDPSSATGLLLDGFQRTDAIINEDWYYGINVVAQFITRDDIGDPVEGTGFYDDKDGSLPPSPEALHLLSKIGVKVTYEVATAAELQTALAYGGNIIVKADITVDAPLVVSADATLQLGTHVLTSSQPLYDTAASSWSLLSVQGADTALTIKNGIFTALQGDGYAVDVRGGAQLVVNGGSFVGNDCAVYVHEGSALINGGSFSSHPGTPPYEELINADDTNLAAKAAQIAICGGSFSGFNPTDAQDGDLVSAGFSVAVENDVYTVAARQAVTE